jgi:3-hydroxyacyl-[acyl-carrier-protein] dehydratase
VPAKEPIVDFAAFDPDHIVADIEEIRRFNPQRFEMEQLTGILLEDMERHICVGFKEVTDHEFWVRGHMPGLPLMPGVVMCEAAAQLASYITQKCDLLGAEMVGFGGMENVRFRDPVRPGDRLIIMARKTKLRRGAVVVCEFQGWVHQTLVVEGEIKGVPLPAAALRAAQ